MTEGITDLFVMIIVLSIVVCIGFGLIIPLLSTDKMSYESNISEKAMTDTILTVNDALIGATVPIKCEYTVSEVLATIYKQESNILQPARITLYDVDNTTVLYTVKLESDYSEKARNIILEVKEKLPNKTLTARYSITYEYADNTIGREEGYAIRLIN